MNGAELEASRCRFGHEGRNILNMEHQLHADLPELDGLGCLVDEYPRAGIWARNSMSPSLTSPVVMKPKCLA